MTLIGILLISLAVPGQSLLGPLKSRTGIPYEDHLSWQIENDKGWVAFLNGDLPKASARFKAAIEIMRPYEKIDPRTMARSYCDLAMVLYSQNRYEQAEPLARWSLEVREKSSKVQPTAVYQNLYVLAQILCAQRRYKEAEPILRRALALLEKPGSRVDADLGAAHNDLAWILTENGKLNEAAKSYSRALSHQINTLPPSDLAIAETSEKYAAILQRLNRVTEAQWHLARAKAIREGSSSSDPQPDPPPAPKQPNTPQASLFFRHMTISLDIKPKQSTGPVFTRIVHAHSGAGHDLEFFRLRGFGDEEVVA